jgi:hypothetical protein
VIENSKIDDDFKRNRKNKKSENVIPKRRSSYGLVDADNLDDGLSIGVTGNKIKKERKTVF